MIPVASLLSFAGGPFGKAIGIALACLAIFTFGYVKGSNAMERRWLAAQAEQAKASAKAILKAQQEAQAKRSKDLAASQAAAKAREKLAAENKRLKGRLAEAIKKDPVAKAPACVMSQESFEALNELIGGGI